MAVDAGLPLDISISPPKIPFFQFPVFQIQAFPFPGYQILTRTTKTISKTTKFHFWFEFRNVPLSFAV
jgi:hypothetical protein